MQRKNVVNILFKNSMIISIGLLTYYLVGYNLMYPGEGFEGGFIGRFALMDWGAGAVVATEAMVAVATDAVAATGGGGGGGGGGVSRRVADGFDDQVAAMAQTMAYENAAVDGMHL